MIVKNALKAISRSKIKNSLIVLVMSVVLTAAFVALIICRSADASAQKAIADVEISGYLEWDSEAQIAAEGRDNYKRPDDPGIEEREALAKLPEVKDAEMKIELQVGKSDDLKFVPEPPQPEGGLGFASIGKINGTKMPDFSLEGYSASGLQDIKNGNIKVVEGALFEFGKVNNQVLIHQELAELNGFKVGSKFHIENQNKPDEKYELQVAGIILTQPDDNAVADHSSMVQNKIISNFETAAAIAKHSADTAVMIKGQEMDYGAPSNGSSAPMKEVEVSSKIEAEVSSTYKFATLADYNNFIPDAKGFGLLKKGYWKMYSSDLQRYEERVAPLKSLPDFAWFMMWIILGVGAIIIITINLITIRERRYEMGVYTAMGIRKPKVVLQFVAETLVITMVAVAVGIGLGSVLAEHVASSLLSSQAAAEQAEEEAAIAAGGSAYAHTHAEFNSIGQMTDVPDGPIVTELHAEVNPKDVAALFGLGLLLSIVSSIVAVVSVVRFNPLKILADR